MQGVLSRRPSGVETEATPRRAKPSEWVSVSSPTHVPPPASPPEMRHPRWKKKSSCDAKVEAEKSGTEMRITEPGKPPQSLVTEVGRKRGFYDNLPDFGDPVLTPSCAHVLFEFQRTLWVVNVATGRKGPLAHGSFLTFASS